MKKHIKIYLDSFGTEKPKSEISGAPADDIHHIQPRGMGGSNYLDRIENLMALTRQEHLEYGDVRDFKAMLYKIHKRVMERKGIRFNEEWIDHMIYRYENSMNKENL